MPTYYCNYFFLFGTRGPLTLGGPLDFAYPAYPIVTPLVDRGLAYSLMGFVFHAACYDCRVESLVVNY